MRELGKRSGLAANTILNLENNYTTAQYATLRLLAQALNVPVERLYGANAEQIDALRKPAPNLSRLQKERGISNNRLVKLARVTTRTLISLESGGTARLGTLRRIAEVLQVPVEELIGE